MRKLSREEQPTYVLRYPRSVALARFALAVLLASAALVRWGLAWVGLARLLAAEANVVPYLLRPFATAHLSLLLTAGSLALIYAFLPNLGLTDDGLAVRRLTGWYVVPWPAVTAVRILSFEKPGRRLVLVQGTWARWSPWPRLVSLCLGAGLEPGLVFGSAIRDFGPLVRKLYEKVRRAAPEAPFDEDFFSLPAHLVLEPGRTVADLVHEAREVGWPLSISAQAMAAVPAGLVVVQGLLLLLQGGAWWLPFVVIGLCELEWLLGALYLYALAEVFPAHVEFRESLLLYPMVQVPRALLALPMAMLVAAGVPFLAAMAGLAAVIWSVMLTAMLVQRLFRLKSFLPTAAGAVFQALFQFMVLALALAG